MRKKYETVSLFATYPKSTTIATTYCTIKTFNNTFTYDMIGVIDIEIAAGTVTEVAINGVTYSSAVKVDPSKGYDSWSKMKRDIGSAGDGNEWHHIVEQSQIDKSGFSSKMVNNPDNVVPIPREVHQKITGYYNSKPEFTNGLTYREWLAGQSYETQYECGLEILEKFLRK